MRPLVLRSVQTSSALVSEKKEEPTVVVNMGDGSSKIVKKTDMIRTFFDTFPFDREFDEAIKRLPSR